MSTLSQFFGGNYESGGIASMVCTKGASENTVLSPYLDVPYNYGGASWALSYLGSVTTSAAADAFRIDGGNIWYARDCGEVIYRGSGIIVNLSGTCFLYWRYLKRINKCRFILHGSSFEFNSAVTAAQRTLETIDEFAAFFMSGSTFISITNCASFANIYKFDWYCNDNNTVTLDLSNNALSAATIELLLTTIDQKSRTGTGVRSIQLQGGTSAGISSLSAAALAARTSLISKGYTIVLNP